VVWDKRAELCNQYLQKGRAVFVEGRLQSRSFEDSSGNKRNVLEVRAERVQFLGPRPASSLGTKEQGDSTEDMQKPPSSEDMQKPPSSETWLEQVQGETNEAS